MNRVVILVPRSLIFEESIKFISYIFNLPIAKQYVFDFAETKRIDSFSLIFLSSEIHRFRHERIISKFIGKNFEHFTYGAHMGFFQAFGMDYGNKPGSFKGNNNYIPISLFNADKIKERAKELLINPAEILEIKAKEISKLLTRKEEGDLFNVLSYSIREILRNIIEHSQSHEFGFCAQYLPSKNLVSFAILDRGIGIKKGLSGNPTLQLESHLEAIEKSLEPGVSGKVFKGQKRKPKGDWANSGYGLFMTSSLCKLGGSFFIASGDKGIYLSEKQKRILDTPLQGTALNLTFDITRLKNLDVMLAEIRKNVSKSSIKASPSSMGLITNLN
ncbi:hypothetical protein [Rufibacter radiotolerans]|nr:hypothetical protein [Rufibacter radiotolerans]